MSGGCRRRPPRRQRVGSAPGSPEDGHDRFPRFAARRRAGSLRETEPERIDQLDEDDLLELHARVRRARTECVELYRRQASARVEDLGGRGFARPENRRNSDEAEIFEDALAGVSRQPAVLARQAAAELEVERLAAATATSSGPHAGTRVIEQRAGDSRVPAHVKTTGGQERDASSRAQGARRQAARDGR